MPGSVIAAIVGAVVASSSALVTAVGVLGASIIGGIAAAATNFLVSSIIGGKGGRTENNYEALPTTTSNFAAEAKGTVVTVRESMSPWRVVYGQARVGGVLTYVEAAGNNAVLWNVLTVAGHSIDSFVSFYANDDLLVFNGGATPTYSYYANYVVLPSQFYLNSGEWLYIYASCGDEGGQPFGGLVSESAGLWTDAHRQTGRAKFAVRMLYNSDVFPSGVPNFSAIIKGKKVYDSRTGVTAWSDNPALCVLDYLLSTSYGMSVPLASVDTASFNAAANICDETVNLATGGTEKRFTCNGVFTVDQSPDQILPKLLSSMAGRLVYVSGKYYLYAGAYLTPTLTLTEDDLRGPIDISPRLSKRDLFNSVRGAFAYPGYLYQPTPYPSVSSSSAISEDNNEELWTEFDLPFTTSPTMCMRLAKIELGRNRRQVTVVARWSMKAYRLQACDTVYLTISKYGWAAKVFEVIESGFGIDNGTLYITLILRETDSDVYTWSTIEERDMAPAAISALPNPFAPASPGSLSFLETLFESLAGVATKLTISWTAPDDYFAQSGLAIYQLEYKESISSDWIVVTNIKGLSHEVFNLAPAIYNWRIKAINVAGVSSAYTSTQNYSVVGLLNAPTMPTGFTVKPIAGLALLQWNESPDLDVRRGGKIELRHTAVDSIWANTALLDEFPGSAVQGYAPLVYGLYLLRARDSSNVYSNSWATFNVSEALVTGFTTVASIVETPSYAGSKTTLVATNNVLILAESGGAVSSLGTYYWPASSATFPTWVDCGSGTARRLELDINVIRYSTSSLDLIDNRGNVDEWSTVDGGILDTGNVKTYVRGTYTHPNSSPTWSSWNLFTVAELDFRAYQFKSEWENTTTAGQVGISSLACHIKKPG